MGLNKKNKDIITDNGWNEIYYNDGEGIFDIIVTKKERPTIEEETKERFSKLKDLIKDPTLLLKKKKYIAFADRDSHDLYHNLRREKYGFSDKMLDILAFGATSKENCESIPVRLE